MLSDDHAADVIPFFCPSTFDGMRRARFLIALLYFLSPSLAGQEKSEAIVPLEERMFIASKVYSLLQLHFFSAKTESAPDLDGTYRTYLHKVLATDDRREFDLATIEFVAQLHNGHTFFWDKWLDKDNNQSLGFYAMPLEGRWVVQSSFLDSLKPGDILSRIDDTPIEAFFLQQRRYISASSTAALRRNLFLFSYLFPEQFTLTLKDGRQVVINRAASKKLPEKTEGRWVKPGATAYIRIPSFFDPLLEQRALDYVRQFRRAKVLIIDVRNNPGGVPPQRLLWVLMDRPYHGWAESTHVGRASIDSGHDTARSGESAPGADDPQGVPNPVGGSPSNSNSMPSSRVITPGPYAFRGRLILLVDGGCISACEDFVEASKDSGRATVVGEITQGSSSPPFIYDFHNGMSFRIAVKRYYFPDGSEFEGVGVKPDIEVHTTIGDLKNGRDPILEKALELAAKP
jgi:carboxyl-terminal processing protease